jgi:hypothetical protein
MWVSRHVRTTEGAAAASAPQHVVQLAYLRGESCKHFHCYIRVRRYYGVTMEYDNSALPEGLEPTFDFTAVVAAQTLLKIDQDPASAAHPSQISKTGLDLMKMYRDSSTENIRLTVRLACLETAGRLFGQAGDFPATEEVAREMDALVAGVDPNEIARIPEHLRDYASRLEWFRMTPEPATSQSIGQRLLGLLQRD